MNQKNLPQKPVCAHTRKGFSDMVKRKMKEKGVTQVFTASGIECDLSTFNRFCNGWGKLPDKYVIPLLELLEFSVEEVLPFIHGGSDE